MKNFQQNLLIALALGLCALCAWQWYGQTIQRNQIGALNQNVYKKAAVIRDYTNSIANMNHHIAQMDAELTGLKATLHTNEEQLASQRTEINRLLAVGEELTNQVSEYKEGVATLQDKLKEAYAGIQKQNDALKQLVAQRDDFVKKYNDSVKDRNDVVAKYNALVDQVNKQNSWK